MHQLFRRTLIALLLLTSLFASSAFAADVTVTVLDHTSDPFTGIRVYAYTESGSYTGKNALTDAYGVALLGTDTDFSAGSYKFRIDYLGHQFWTDPIILPDTTAITFTIGMESTEVSVYTSTGPADNIRVYLFSSSESYLSDYGYTGTDGKVLFSLPVSGSFKFRADITGHQYWSDVIQIVQGGPNLVDIDAGGGIFRIFLGEDINTPMSGIRSYLFKDNGSYLSQYADTDASGVVEFNVPEGNYMVRADYLGYQFYTDVTFVNTDTEINHLIPHQDAVITVNSQFQGEDPMDGVRVYLYTEAGSYQNLNQYTDANGQVVFHLPNMAYKVRADYLTKQFWSDPFLPQDFDLNIPMADARVFVGWGDSGLEDIPVYVFSTTGSYTNVNGTTDATGHITFRLPADTWRFRTDYQSNQYWSVDSPLTADQVIPVEIATGGGSFNFTVLKGDSDPLEGVNCYVFDEDDNYFGMYGPSSSSGLITFDLAAGNYKIRVDHIGYQFWTEVYQIPDVLSDTFTILHSDVTITVNGVFGTPTPIENVPVHLFTPAGASMNLGQTTDQAGQVSFNIPDTAYKVRVDYMGIEFWSDEFTGQDTDVNIPMADAEITVVGEGLPIEGIPVYVFSESGAYQNFTLDTDAQGKAVFRLPEGNFKFRADYLGNQYWSDVITLTPEQVNPVEIDASGGPFVLTVLRGPSDPLVGAKCYVFSDSGSYLGVVDTTDSNGQVFFDLTDGCYKFRVDHLGYQFWTDIYTVPNQLSDVFTILHQNVNVTVNGVFDAPSPLEGLKVYLFTSSGSYQNQYQITDTAGLVSFFLPEKEYKVRVDYRGQQFWSDTFIQQDVAVDIPMADAEITVTGGGHIIEGVTVHVFSPTNTYLNVLGTTDENGKVVFRLPASAYRFRATYQGSQFWNNDQPLTAGQVNPLEIATGGGIFTLTVMKNASDPLTGASCYVFTEGGTYIGLSGTIDENGTITFDLADGQYKMRIDYMGHQFWTDVYTLPETFSSVFTIPHKHLPVYVFGLNPGPSPIAEVMVYLFTGSGSYVNQNPETDAEGRVVFLLPEKEYKVRVTVDSVTYWSEILRPQGTIVAINQGTGDILPKVSDFTLTTDDNGQVILSWTPPEDYSPLVLGGYNIYRRYESETMSTKINDTLIDPQAATYADNQAVQTGIYYYYISAVDTSGVEGYPSLIQAVSIRPENTTPITGLSVSWDQDDAVLTWNHIDGLKYQIYRGLSEQEISEFDQTQMPPYQDTSAAYYYDWYFQMATIREYENPSWGGPIQEIGPISAIVVLNAQSRPIISIPAADLDAVNNTYTVEYGPGQVYDFCGTYAEMTGDVVVTATNSTTTLTGAGSNGSFCIQLTDSGQWQVTITEDGGWKTTTFNVNVSVDDQPPELIVNGEDTRTVSEAFIELQGTAVDAMSGIDMVYTESDQYPGNVFNASITMETGAFACEVPLKEVKDGENLLTVTALDNAGNTSQHQISVTFNTPALPLITILSPANNAVVSANQITLSGAVRSSLPPEQIRLILNNEILFPSGTDHEYTFSFDNILLVEGINTLIVTAETPYGNVSAQTVVTYQATTPATEDDPAVFDINAPQPEIHVTDDTVVIKGTVCDENGIQSVLVNGQAATIVGSGECVSFEYEMLFSDMGSEEIDIDIVAIDSDDNATSYPETITYFHDDTPPVITIPGLQPAPDVNTVDETPYTLAGTVVEKNLASLVINNQSISVLPTGVDDTWSFNVDIPLERNNDLALIIEAGDLAGNMTSREVILNLGSTLDIEVISPRDGITLTANDTTLDVEVTVRVPGIAADDTVSVGIDGQAPTILTPADTNAHGTVNVQATDGEHEMNVVVTSTEGTQLARQLTHFSIVNTANIPLEVSRQEPENNATGIGINEIITFYFNKPIDPALLQITVKETAHGLNYADPEQGADLTTLNDIQLVEVHRDNEDVPGGISHFPGNTMAAFYPERDFAYNATVYVTLTYDSTDIHRTTFTVRPLPTFIQGFVADQYSQPIAGLEILLSELGKTAITDENGSFGFGFGEKPDQAIPPGRYKAVFNPNLKNITFGMVERWVTVNEGRLNSVGMITLPVLDTKEPFRHIQSGQEAILKGGDLTLNLTQAEIVFPDGKNEGDIHVQFLTLSQFGYDLIPAAIPHWAYAIQPAGVEIMGDVSITFSMPKLYESHDYVAEIGERVVLIGLDASALQIVPVGIGQVHTDTNTVTSVGSVKLDRLDYLGYALIASELQPILEQVENGELSLNEMISLLTQENQIKE